MNRSILIGIMFSFFCCTDKRTKQYKFAESYFKYYSYFSGYEHPVKLVDEISFEEAEKKNSYYIATYEKDRVIKIEKILYKKSFFTYIYKYNKEGVLDTVEIIDKNGSRNLISK